MIDPIALANPPSPGLRVAFPLVVTWNTLTE